MGRRKFDMGRKNVNSILETGDWSNYDDLQIVIDEAINTGRYSTKGFVELLNKGYMETNVKKKSDRISAIEEILIRTQNVKACDALLNVLKTVIDRETRDAIIRITCELGDSRLDKRLVSMLRDKSRPVRDAANVILKHIGRRSTFELLKSSCLDNGGWASKREAIDVLYYLDPTESIPVFSEIIAEGNKAEVRFAIEKLSKIRNRQAKKVIIEASRNESARIRLWGTQALVEINEPELTEELIRLTGDENVSVAMAAVEGLEKQKGKESIQCLVELLENDDNRLVSRSIDALKHVGDDSAIEPLVEKLRSRDFSVRHSTMETLVHLGRSQSVNTCKMLVDIMMDPDVNVRRCAVEVISSLGAEGVMWELFQHIKDEDWWVRERVANLFCELKDHRIIEPVIELLKDPSTKVRRYAVEILNSLPDKRAIKPLLESLTDADWWIRERAIEALGTIKEKKVTPILIRILKFRDLNWVTIHALGEIGSPEAFEPLEKFLSDEREEIRLEALKALEKIKMTEKAQDEIMNLLSDPVKEIRMKAREILGNLLEDIDRKAAEGEQEYKKKYLTELDNYLLEVKKTEASDLCVSPDRRPMMKKHGDMIVLSNEIIKPENTRSMLLNICPPEVKEDFGRIRDTDFSYEIPGEGRFRVNICQQRNGIAGFFRVTPEKPPTIEELKFPQSVYHFTKLHQGLVLVTGPTGCGKSTTLAALVNEINETRFEHIITIEDPIEYIHTPKNCIINQRELGQDTLSFSNALRSALREDPDIILVGELRDLETISMAITAAETGHLVFGTLHTTDAAKSVDRIIDVFPSSQTDLIRTMLSESLVGVISQQLVRQKEGGMIAAMEILMTSAALRKMIRDGKTFQIPTVMITGQDAGMQSMDQALMKLYKKGIITIAEAYSHAVSKKEFEDYLKEEGQNMENFKGQADELAQLLMEENQNGEN